MRLEPDAIYRCASVFCCLFKSILKLLFFPREKRLKQHSKNQSLLLYTYSAENNNPYFPKKQLLQSFNLKGGGFGCWSVPQLVLLCFNCYQYFYNAIKPNAQKNHRKLMENSLKQYMRLRSVSCTTTKLHKTQSSKMA